MVGTWVGTEIVVGALRPIRITRTRDRSPGAASFATSRVISHHPIACSVSLALPLIPDTFIPVEGEISAAWTAVPAGNRDVDDGCLTPRRVSWIDSLDSGLRRLRALCKNGNDGQEGD